MGDKYRQELIDEMNRKYHREYMRDYLQRDGFKEKATQYRENWLYIQAIREQIGRKGMEVRIPCLSHVNIADESTIEPTDAQASLNGSSQEMM
ncbi:hypothetical protein AB7942_21695 [Neobacillus sp. BF23-41]|uniref:hypothetical protein n=1 Tax=Neobacillus sp. BF23-41 TaxID=3240280 RepID=UPI0034E42490